MIARMMWTLFGVALLTPAVFAQEPGITSQSQIEAALADKPKTRGLRVRATNEEGKSAAAKIDLNIPFELNSSELRPQAVAQLEALQSALHSEGLAQSRFLVAGHTDARGSAEHNQTLSLQRANAVKRYLVARGVAEARLQSAGEGASQLLTPDDPNNAANRRVEIRNLGSAP